MRKLSSCIWHCLRNYHYIEPNPSEGVLYAKLRSSVLFGDFHAWRKFICKNESAELDMPAEKSEEKSEARTGWHSVHSGKNCTLFQKEHCTQRGLH